jgi:hypothetical protein
MTGAFRRDHPHAAHIGGFTRARREGARLPIPATLVSIRSSGRAQRRGWSDPDCQTLQPRRERLGLRSWDADGTAEAPSQANATA